MKKLIALMISLVMMLGCAAAFAETAEEEKLSIGTIDINGAFELRGYLPEGYEVSMVREGGDSLIAMIANPDDDSAPIMMLSVAFDELYSDVQRLNDLDDETLAEIEATFAEEDTVDISYAETAYGTKLMVIRESEDATDYVVFYTIYMGYSVEFALTTGFAEDAPALTDHATQMALDFLSDLDFIAAE